MKVSGLGLNGFAVLCCILLDFRSFSVLIVKQEKRSYTPVSGLRNRS